MLLPLACLKRDFLKVLQSLRGYIDTILPKSLGHIARVAYRQACPEAVVRGLWYPPAYLVPTALPSRRARLVGLPVIPSLQ